MLYFGSRNFGEGNWGKGLITTAVDETLTTSTMQVAGYNFFNTGTIDAKAVVNVDVAAGMVRLGYLNITSDATMIASKILMKWVARTNPGVEATMQVSGKIGWDSQFVDDATWTDQTVS